MTSTNNYKIAYKALSIGEHTYNFAINDSLFTPYEGTEILGGSGKVDVLLKRSESMLELQVDISAVVSVECDRCLEPCEIEIDFSAPLLVKFSDQTDLYDGEVMWLPTATSEVDLSHYIYESIIISLPYQRVHAEGECNKEMLERFKSISSEEFDKLEEQNSKVKSHGMGGEQLDKLAALKGLMARDDE